MHYDEDRNFVFAVREPVSKNGKAVTWTLLLRMNTPQKNAAGAKAAAAWVKGDKFIFGLFISFFRGV